MKQKEGSCVLWICLNKITIAGFAAIKVFVFSLQKSLWIKNENQDIKQLLPY